MVCVFRIYLPPLVPILSFVGEGAKRLGAAQLTRQLVGLALVLNNCGFTHVIENMVRESGLRTWRPAGNMAVDCK